MLPHQYAPPPSSPVNSASAAESPKPAQVVPAMRVSFQDRRRHHLMAAAVGVNLVLLGAASVDAFIVPPSNRRICGQAAPSALFVASMPKKGAATNPNANSNTNNNPVRELFGREGGADSVGLQSGLGADHSEQRMTSILDDGSGHVNAELARSIWQWGECGHCSVHNIIVRCMLIGSSYATRVLVMFTCV